MVLVNQINGYAIADDRIHGHRCLSHTREPDLRGQVDVLVLAGTCMVLNFLCHVFVSS